MKKILLILFVLTLLPGCGISLSSKKINFTSINSFITKKMSFHPYVNYRPNIVPSENCERLLEELYIYRKLINDHQDYYSTKIPNNTNKKIRNKLKGLFTKRNKKETLEKKIVDINEIKALTKRYEDWPKSWEENVDIVGEKLSIDEIDLVKYEIKENSKINIYF